MANHSATAPGRRARLPGAIMLQLLYGRHAWITRDAGSSKVTFATGKMASGLSSTLEPLHLALEVLEGMGLVANVRWQRGFCTLNIVTPIGYGLITNPEVMDV